MIIFLIVLFLVIFLVVDALVLFDFFSPYIAIGVGAALLIFLVPRIANEIRRKKFYDHCIKEGIEDFKDQRIYTIGEYHKIGKPYDVFKEIYLKKHPSEASKQNEANKSKIRRRTITVFLCWLLGGAAIGSLAFLLFGKGNVPSYLEGSTLGLYILGGIIAAIIGTVVWAFVSVKHDEQKKRKKVLEEKLHSTSQK